MRIDTNFDWEKALHYTRAGFDDVLDYIPFVSIVNSVIDGIQKKNINKYKKNEKASNSLNPYDKRITKKHKWTMIALAVPGINIFVALYRDSARVYKHFNKEKSATHSVNSGSETAETPPPPLTPNRESTLRRAEPTAEPTMDEVLDELDLDVIPESSSSSTVSNESDLLTEEMVKDTFNKYINMINPKNQWTFEQLKNESLSGYENIKKDWAQIVNENPHNQLYDYQVINGCLLWLHDQKLTEEFGENIPEDAFERFSNINFVGDVLIYCSLYGDGIEEAQEIMNKVLNTEENINVLPDVTKLINELEVNDKDINLITELRLLLGEHTSIVNQSVAINNNIGLIERNAQRGATILNSMSLEVQPTPTPAPDVVPTGLEDDVIVQPKKTQFQLVTNEFCNGELKFIDDALAALANYESELFLPTLQQKAGKKYIEDLQAFTREFRDSCVEVKDALIVMKNQVAENNGNYSSDEFIDMFSNTFDNYLQPFVKFMHGRRLDDNKILYNSSIGEANIPVFNLVEVSFALSNKELIFSFKFSAPSAG